MVGARNTADTGSSGQSPFDFGNQPSREKRVPARSKKLSWIPTSNIPSTFFQIREEVSDALQIGPVRSGLAAKDILGRLLAGTTAKGNDIRETFVSSRRPPRQVPDSRFRVGQQLPGGWQRNPPTSDLYALDWNRSEL